MHNLVSLHSILLIAVVAHFVIAAVMSLFARHKVQYLSLAWIMAIFAVVSLGTLAIDDFIQASNPGILHPAMLLALTATVFLQSIYPLSITMPAFLQWGRSWKYASPAVILFAIYGVALIFGLRPVAVYTWAELWQHLFSSDILLRFSMLALSIYYIVNIFRLPRVMLRNPDTPHYLFGYAFALGLSLSLYTWLVIEFSVDLLCLWIIVFTAVNLYLCLRVLETMAIHLPTPDIIALDKEPVGVSPTDETDETCSEEDFNEANQHRFERIEHWMQHNKPLWTDYTFGRDQLCEHTGINRHLMLQSIRSQGYYNIHEYISRYRIDELQRMIQRGEVTTLSDCLDAGFATIKTIRIAFEKFTGDSLDNFLAKHCTLQQ